MIEFKIKRGANRKARAISTLLERVHDVQILLCFTKLEGLGKLVFVQGVAVAKFMIKI